MTTAEDYKILVFDEKVRAENDIKYFFRVRRPSYVGEIVVL
jgi:hypothetical protein